MQCSECGAENPEGTQWCISCRKPLRAAAGTGRKTSGTAIASLVCGLAGFVTCGLAGLVGLVLGIVSLGQIGKRPAELEGRGMAIAGIVVSSVSLFTVVVVSLMAAMLMPALSRARDEARKAVGMSYVFNIGLAVLMYENEHGETPPTLEALLEGGYLADPSVLIHPADDQLAMWDGGSSFIYVGSLPSGLPEEVIICYARAGIYFDGRTVLNHDMVVEQVSEFDLHDPNGSPRTSLIASYNAVVDALGDELTLERDAELRVFYEVDG